MDYSEMLESIKGKTIAIVYFFEGEDAPGAQHYHVWKSDVIALWMQAVESLRCIPLILDVRTFVEKALSRTLPPINYVLNLNCGSWELSPLGLVPSTCAFIGVPCIPCDAVTIVTSENKLLSNIIAAGSGLNVPQKLPSTDNRGIFRPLSFGSSYGVMRGQVTNQYGCGIYQEFIPGFDITTPIVFNPITEAFDEFPSIIYVPDSGNMEWFFGEDEKNTGTGYRRESILSLSVELKAAYTDFIKTMGIKTFCRIDARLRADSIAAIEDICNRPLGIEDLYFVEINSMPTIKKNNSFGFCYSQIQPGNAFYSCVLQHKEYIQNSSVHSFLLSCAMLALEPSTKEKRI